MFNQVQLIGFLGGDPELKYTQNQMPFCYFSLATSEKWKDKQGEVQEKTEWHRITLWGSVAEVASKYAQKGSKVFLQGKLETQEFTDKDGQKRQTTKIIGQVLKLLDQRPEYQKGGDPGIRAPMELPPKNGGDSELEDIPF